jgi:hypothetical protein
MFKVIIAGGRDFKDFNHLCEVVDHMLQNKDDIEVVSGTAMGADQLGEKYAKECGYALKEFPADWEEFGKAAGHIRNRQMGDYADALIAFWDGKSKGTKGMIEYARTKDLQVAVVTYKKK